MLSQVMSVVKTNRLQKRQGTLTRIIKDMGVIFARNFDIRGIFFSVRNFAD